MAAVTSFSDQLCLLHLFVLHQHFILTTRTEIKTVFLVQLGHSDFSQQGFIIYKPALLYVCIMRFTTGGDFWTLSFSA